jgi:hypothetical protein
LTLRIRIPALLGVLGLVLVPSARADETITQTVPTGGTITTGTVSADDPVQLSFTAVRGGTVTIVKRTTPGAAVKGYQGFGPQFEVTGDAELGEGRFLVASAAMPIPNARGSNLRIACLQENTQGGTAHQECGNYQIGGILKTERTAEGDFSLLWFQPASAAARAATWDLSRHGSAGAGDLFAHLAKADFDGDWDVDDVTSLDAVLKKEGFPLSKFYCNYSCSLTVKFTVSQKVRRALGLASRVIARDVLILEAGKRPSFVVPFGSGVARKLKKRRVAVLGGRLTGFIRGPEGERIKERAGEFYLESREGRFALTCGPQGIPSDELQFTMPKGTNTCPD